MYIAVSIADRKRAFFTKKKQRLLKYFSVKRERMQFYRIYIGHFSLYNHDSEIAQERATRIVKKSIKLVSFR